MIQGQNPSDCYGAKPPENNSLGTEPEKLIRFVYRYMISTADVPPCDCILLQILLRSDFQLLSISATLYCL